MDFEYGRTDCPFCDADVIARQKVYETDRSYLLHNIRPATKGQVIAVPKSHVTNIRRLSPAEREDLFSLVNLAGGVLKAELDAEGLNFGWNEGYIAGQRVEHYHVHILPRFKGDRVFRNHLFHRPEEIKRNLEDEELRRRVEEIRGYFR